MKKQIVIIRPKSIKEIKEECKTLADVKALSSEVLKGEVVAC